MPVDARDPVDDLAVTMDYRIFGAFEVSPIQDKLGMGEHIWLHLTLHRLCPDNSDDGENYPGNRNYSILCAHCAARAMSAIK